jgi:hypothetical protein
VAFVLIRETRQWIVHDLRGYSTYSYTYKWPRSLLHKSLLVAYEQLAG